MCNWVLFIGQSSGNPCGPRTIQATDVRNRTGSEVLAAGRAHRWKSSRTPASAVPIWSPSAEDPKRPPGVHSHRRPPLPWVRTSGPAASAAVGAQESAWEAWCKRESSSFWNRKHSRQWGPQARAGVPRDGIARRRKGGFLGCPPRVHRGHSLLVWKDRQASGACFPWRALSALEDLGQQWQELCGQPERTG